MITGRKRLPADRQAPRMANPLIAAAVFACAIGIVATFATAP